MFILNNNSKIKTIEELNKVMSGTNCEYCRHYNNEEYCNGDNPQCDGERNLNNFSFVGIKEIIEEKTDFEKFKNLLDLLNVGYKIESVNNYNNEYDPLNIKEVQIISLIQGNKNIVGYCMFYAEIIFDLKGKFIRFGIYE